MKCPFFAGFALLISPLAAVAHAQIVHISATSENLWGQLVGYPQDEHPMGGVAKFDLHYDASIAGTDGIFTFDDPAKNYWTLSVAFTDYEPDAGPPFADSREFSFPLETLSFGLATESGIPGMFALTSLVDGQYFDFGLIPPGSPTVLPVPPFTFGTNFNFFHVSWRAEGWEGDHTFSGPLNHFTAEVVSPIPEPSVCGAGGAIAVLCFITYGWRGRGV